MEQGRPPPDPQAAGRVGLGMPDAVPQSAEGGAAELEAPETADGSDGRGECSRQSRDGRQAADRRGGLHSRSRSRSRSPLPALVGSGPDSIVTRSRLPADARRSAAGSTEDKDEDSDYDSDSDAGDSDYDSEADEDSRSPTHRLPDSRSPTPRLRSPTPRLLERNEPPATDQHAAVNDVQVHATVKPPMHQILKSTRYSRVLLRTICMEVVLNSFITIIKFAKARCIVTFT